MLLVKAAVSAVMSLVCLATAAVFAVLMCLHFWRINDDDDDDDDWLVVWLRDRV